MPWLETAPMDQRIQFLTDHRRGLYPVTELCARYGISRKTGYKWLDQFEGTAGVVCRIGAARPTTAPTESPPSLPHGSARRGETGGRRTPTASCGACAKTWF